MFWSFRGAILVGFFAAIAVFIGLAIQDPVQFNNLKTLIPILALGPILACVITLLRNHIVRRAFPTTFRYKR